MPSTSQVAGTGLERRDLRAASWRRLRSPHGLALAVVLLLALAFYMWTAYTAAPFDFHADNDVYNELTTGFLHGHTYLPLTPPAGLLRLRNPFDPAQNSQYAAGGYHDLSLYHGRFYSQWGPTAAVTLFLPFRITGLTMSESFAVALFAFIGLACAVALLCALVRRFVPDTPGWLLVSASAGLALANAVPFLLRRPAQYEVAISSGYCFEMAGLLLVFTAIFHAPVRRTRLAFGSLCLGLAVGGRPTLALGAGVALIASLYVIRRRREPYSLLISALGPLIVVGLCLVAYNVVRFGSPTEFGQSYELAGVNQTILSFYQLAYIPPGLFSYLLLPARLALTFPHAFLMTASAYPGTLPRDYAGATPAFPGEPVGGVLTTMPITLVLLVLPILWIELRGKDRRALLVAGMLAAIGLAIATLVSWALFGTTERYEVDFATLFLLAAFIVWAVMLGQRPRRTMRRRVIAIGGIGLTTFGALVGTAISFTGYYDTLRIDRPATFRTLEDITSPFATLATMIAGKAVIARVDAGAVPVALAPIGYGTFDEGDASTYLGGDTVTVTVISPRSEDVGLGAFAAVAAGGPPLQTLVVRVQSPGRQANTVPMISAHIRFPIHLHWGLNRITLSLAGPQQSPNELALQAINLVP